MNERDLEDEQTFNQKVLESLFPYRIKTLSRMQYIFTYLGPNKKFSVDFRMLTNFFTKAVFNWCELKFDKNLTTAELMHFLVEREFCPIFSKLVKLDLSELNENQFATIARFYPKEIAKHISYLLFCNSDLNIKVFKEVIERFPNLKLVKIIYCNNLSKEAVGNTLNDCELEIYGKYTTEHCYSNW